MINSKSNRQALKEAMFALKLVKGTMADVNEQDNPNIDTVKTLMCIQIDDAIGYLEQLKNGLK